MSLKRKALGAAKWTSLSALVTSSMQLIQLVVLARFLDKKDFGLMSIALLVIGLSQIFTDIGISNAIVHKQNVSKTQLSTLYWINILIGLFIYILLLFASPLLSDFYESPELTEIIRWISLSFLIIPFGQQFETILSKELSFKELSKRDIIGKTIGLILSIFLAYSGFGVYALVYANLASTFVSSSLLVAYGLKIYRPEFTFSIKSLKNQGFFSFGLYQMGEKIVNYFNSQFDTLLIGKLLGMEALGVYNIAKNLAFRPYQIINPIITKVAFPVLSKVQNDIDKLKSSYLQILNMLTLVNAPVYALMIILAEPITILFFGKMWIESVPYLQILSIAALCNSIGNPIGALLLARGRADMGFYWNLGMLLFMPLSIWLGSFGGLKGVALGTAIFKIVVMFPAWSLFAYPLCKARFQEYFGSFMKPVMLAVACSMPALILTKCFSNSYLNLAIGSLVMSLLYFGAVFIVKKKTQLYN